MGMHFTIEVMPIKRYLNIFHRVKSKLHENVIYFINSVQLFTIFFPRVYSPFTSHTHFSTNYEVENYIYIFLITALH